MTSEEWELEKNKNHQLKKMNLFLTKVNHRKRNVREKSETLCRGKKTL